MALNFKKERKMSNVDKSIRLVIAVIWIFGFVCESWWWAVGILPILSAVYGYCPLYKLRAKCPLCKKANAKFEIINGLDSGICLESTNLMSESKIGRI